VKKYYKDLLIQINELHHKRLGNLIIPNKRKHLPDDDGSGEVSYKKIKEMTKKNGALVIEKILMSI